VFINRGPFRGNLSSKFTSVFELNLFKGSQSLSGAGSDFVQTKTLATSLPVVLKKMNVRSLLDVPCGDFNWMSQVDLSDISYTGADIVPQLIQKLNIRFESLLRTFTELNIVEEVPEPYDAIFSRDLFVHLSNNDIHSSILNMKLSKSSYLLATTFPSLKKNRNLPLITRGVAWRPINLEIHPFCLPAPIYRINEDCTEGAGKYADKSIGVWNLGEL
jgi:hypothetical protein